MEIKFGHCLLNLKSTKFLSTYNICKYSYEKVFVHYVMKLCLSCCNNSKKLLPLFWKDLMKICWNFLNDLFFYISVTVSMIKDENDKIWEFQISSISLDFCVKTCNFMSEKSLKILIKEVNITKIYINLIVIFCHCWSCLLY